MTGTDFYQHLTPRPDFAEMTRSARFAPLPDDWLVGATDIVDSTGLIADGRYKLVNTVGACAISALMNALDGRPFPFVFGGDGASFAVPGRDGDTVRRTLAVLRRWVGEEFAIPLRAALVPVADIRAAGHDVRVARFAASAGVDYAMFAGGGMAWVEARMKAGDIGVDPDRGDAVPDLAGLSCRWNNVKARNGMILSLLVLPGARPEGFEEIAAQVVALAEGLDRGGHPVPEEGPSVQYPPPGLTLEAHVSRGRAPLWRRKLGLLWENLIAWGFFRSGLSAGGFDPVHYRATVGRNVDFRKFDDGLKMTLDCDAETGAQLEALLDRAEAQGLVRYGIHRQDEAQVTCIVPSVTQDDHVHFIDGASGGYTAAAARIKAPGAGAKAGTGTAGQGPAG